MELTPDFLGRCVWGLHQDFYRDKPQPKPEHFRLWTELRPEEQEFCIFIGLALLNTFRSIEGNQVLRDELTELKADYDTLSAEFRRRWKDSGGTQNPVSFSSL